MDRIERWVRIAKEVLLAGGGLALVVYFLPVLVAVRGRLTPGNLESVSVGPISVKLRAEIATFAPDNLPLEAVAGHPMMLTKGSLAELGEVRERLQESPGGRIDVLVITPGKVYGTELLQAYVSQLNVRFVVFHADTLDGWIDAGGFAAQLVPGREYLYEQLHRALVGLNRSTVQSDLTARSVLEKMQQLRTDNLAVVDARGQFRFIVSREDILSRLVTSALLASAR